MNDWTYEWVRVADCAPPTDARFFAPEGAPTHPFYALGRWALQTVRLLVTWLLGSFCQEESQREIGGLEVVLSSCGREMPWFLLCCHSRQHVSMAPQSPFPSSVHRLALVFSLILLSQNQPQPHLALPESASSPLRRTRHTRAHTPKDLPQLCGTPAHFRGLDPAPWGSSS